MMAVSTRLDPGRTDGLQTRVDAVNLLEFRGQSRADERLRAAVDSVTRK